MDGWQRRYRVSNGPGGLGLSCTTEGLALAGVSLLAKGVGGFQARPAAEVAVLLKRAYAGGEPAAAALPALAKIADALNRGDLAQAMIRAVHLRLPELDWDAAVRLARANDNLAKYSPDQARDDHGRWTDDGETSQEPVKAEQPASARRDVPNKPSAMPEDRGSQGMQKKCGQFFVDEKGILSPSAAKKLFEEELAAMLRSGALSKEEVEDSIRNHRFIFRPIFAAYAEHMGEPLPAVSMEVARRLAGGLTNGFVPGGLTNPATNTTEIYMSAAAPAIIPGLGKTDARRTMQFVLRHELFHQKGCGTCKPADECCADSFAISNMPAMQK
ncbi:hypothetical protein [Nitrospirillum pindoramense]|uniref:Uncharacterized protein n=1 Tax=Nitrospirillum amazonense TaxID=28077 RepID=A0A560HHU9_9PROT|nr:hypothetical protein [Nitrospirillum amazonense]TWB46032.1 hypothetical protein FBZ90_101367 [Nitrospirillum amazonense]